MDFKGIQGLPRISKEDNRNQGFSPRSSTDLHEDEWNSKILKLTFPVPRRPRPNKQTAPMVVAGGSGRGRERMEASGRSRLHIRFDLAYKRGSAVAPSLPLARERWPPHHCATVASQRHGGRQNNRTRRAGSFGVAPSLHLAKVEALTPTSSAGCQSRRRQQRQGQLAPRRGTRPSSPRQRLHPLPRGRGAAAGGARRTSREGRTPPRPGARRCRPGWKLARIVDGQASERPQRSLLLWWYGAVRYGMVMYGMVWCGSVPWFGD